MATKLQPGHTPAPWRSEDRGDRIAIHQPENAPVWVGEVASVEMSDLDEEQDAVSRSNASLIVAAPEHALLLAAMAKGAARWEPFNLNARYPETDPGGGELVVNGMRYTTRLDEFGCPALNDTLRAMLGRVAQ